MRQLKNGLTTVTRLSEGEDGKKQKRRLRISPRLMQAKEAQLPDTQSTRSRINTENCT